MKGYGYNVMNSGQILSIRIGTIKCRFNLDQFMLFFFCAANMHIFYLFPSNFLTRSLTFIWVIVWFVLADIGKINIRKLMRNSSFLVLFLMLILIAANQSKRLYGQSFVMGLSPQRIAAANILVIIPIVVAIQRKSLDYEKIVSVIKIVVIIELFLCVVQFITGSKVTFLHVLMYEHNGRMRIYANIVLMEILYFDILAKLFTGKCVNPKRNVLFLFMIASYIILVAQHRSSILILIAIIAAAVFLWKKVTVGKVVIVCFIVIALVIFINSDYFFKICSAIINNTGTFMVRTNSRKFYIDKIGNNFFLGCGYANADYYNAYVYSGMSKGYLLADNGIYGYLFSYGLAGMIWYIIFLFQLLTEGIKSYLKTGNMFLILCLLFFILGSLTFSWFFEMEMISISITYALLLAIKSKKHDYFSKTENR